MIHKWLLIRGAEQWWRVGFRSAESPHTNTWNVLLWFLGVTAPGPGLRVSRKFPQTPPEVGQSGVYAASVPPGVSLHLPGELSGFKSAGQEAPPPPVPVAPVPLVPAAGTGSGGSGTGVSCLCRWTCVTEFYCWFLPVAQTLCSRNERCLRNAAVQVFISSRADLSSLFSPSP